MQIWIGTSGYSYSDWVGPFYAPGTRPDQMLAFYSHRFPLVELNFTFYRLPSVHQLARLSDKTPANFQFLVKLPKTISHDGSDGDLPAFRQAVDELQDRGRLLGLLCQFPQAFHRLPDSQRRVERLARDLGSYGLAVEFRHSSWFAPDIAPWLQQRNVDLVAVDAPNLPDLYPSGLVQSTRRVYVRFHSRHAGRWYQSDKLRYDYDYSDTQMSEWITALAAASGRAERALVLFNNCYRSQAVQNARRMRELVVRVAPQLELVGPGSTPEPEQRSLFD
jgi:uncharacterized protein YecE (DUF72 family)